MTFCLCVMCLRKLGTVVFTDSSYFISIRGHDLSRVALYTLMVVSTRDKVICRSSAGKTHSPWHNEEYVLFLCTADKRARSRGFSFLFPPCFKQGRPGWSVFLSPSSFKLLQREYNIFIRTNTAFVCYLGARHNRIERKIHVCEKALLNIKFYLIST